MGEITQLIKSIAQQDQAVQTFPAKVIAINRESGESIHEPNDAYTVDVMKADGAILKNVRLKASVQDKDQGIIFIPKDESWVMVSIIETIETRGFISQYSEIERIYLLLKDEASSEGIDSYFQMEINPSTFQVKFKEGSNSTTESPSFKDLVNFQFNADKTLKIEFFNDEEEPNPLVTASLDDSQIAFSFNDTDGTSLLQETKLDKEEVSIIFSEGYEASITKDLVKIHKDELNLELNQKFKIEAGGTDLKAAVTQLIDAIKNLTVTTPSGPSVAPPINVGEFIDAQMTFNQILE